MSVVIGIKEQNTNQISYVFTQEHFEIGDMVIIENGKGEYIYECVRSNEPYSEYAHKLIECKSIRHPKSSELLTYIENQKINDQFIVVFNQMLKEFDINAILVAVDVALDGEHLKYTYFSTDKLHFPKMIKYLLMNNPKRMKIEFYQVGEREYYAINGGIGVCGYELCCHSRSYHTPTITTNSLKSLGININLKKSLTGSCGKYKCCLLFDAADKQKLTECLPDIDHQIEYQGEKVVVTQIDFESQIVTALGAEVIEINFAHFYERK